MSNDVLARAAEKLRTFVHIPDFHRFAPTEKARTVREAKDGQPKIASEIGFNPVATVNMAHQRLYVRGINNTQPRYLRPVAMNGQAILPVRGERVFEFSDSYRNEIASKMEVAARPLTEPKQVGAYLGVATPGFKQTMQTSSDKTKLLADLTKTTAIARGFLNKQQIDKPAAQTPLPPKAPSVQLPKPVQTPPKPTSVATLPPKPAAVAPPVARPVPQQPTVVKAPALPVVAKPEAKVELSANKLDKPVEKPKIQKKALDMGSLSQLSNLAEKVIEANVPLPNSSKASYTPINISLPAVHKPETEIKAEPKPDLTPMIAKLASATVETSKEPQKDVSPERAPQPTQKETSIPEKNERLETSQAEGKPEPEVPAHLEATKVPEETKPTADLSSQGQAQIIAQEVAKQVAAQKQKLEEQIRAEMEKEETQPAQVIQTPVETTQVATNEKKGLTADEVEKLLSQQVFNKPIEAEIKEETPNTPSSPTQPPTNQSGGSQISSSQAPVIINNPTIISSSDVKKPEEPKPVLDPRALAHRGDRQEIQKDIVIAEGKLAKVDREAISEGEKEKLTGSLKGLEHQADIMVQYEGLQYQGEKQRILSEIRALSELFDKKVRESENRAKTESEAAAERQKEMALQKAKVAEEIRALVEKEKNKKAPSRNVVQAQPAFGKMIPPKVSFPNVVNGIVRDKNGLLVSGVVMIIKDPQDEPVRALKSNKIGQFVISTPLPNGTYNIELEKEGLEFNIVQIQVSGEIMKPIEIKAI